MRMSGTWQEWDTTPWTSAKSWHYKWQHRIVRPGESISALSNEGEKNLYLRPEALIPLPGEGPREDIVSTWKMQWLQAVQPPMSELGWSGRAGGILVKAPLADPFSLMTPHQITQQALCKHGLIPWCTCLSYELSKGRGLCRSFS